LVICQNELVRGSIQVKFAGELVTSIAGLEVMALFVEGLVIVAEVAFLAVKAVV
jgi:hypothetical protein